MKLCACVCVSVACLCLLIFVCCLQVCIQVLCADAFKQASLGKGTPFCCMAVEHTLHVCIVDLQVHHSKFPICSW